jgi:hypothetical protein
MLCNFSPIFSYFHSTIKFHYFLVSFYLLTIILVSYWDVLMYVVKQVLFFFDESKNKYLNVAACQLSIQRFWYTSQLIHVFSVQRLILDTTVQHQYIHHGTISPAELFQLRRCGSFDLSGPIIYQRLWFNSNKQPRASKFVFRLIHSRMWWVSTDRRVLTGLINGLARLYFEG